jgi:hypothetical protein
MSCAARFHRYRASVSPPPTLPPASVSWKHVTGHPHHPMHPLPDAPTGRASRTARTERQAVTKTGMSTDDASIPVSLVQYLWSRWQESPPGVRDAVTAIIGELMRSPRWHWHLTVLPDHAPTDPSNPFVIARDGRPTIGIPIAMLRDLWTWVLGNTDQRAPILQWFASGITPSLWQELCAMKELTGWERYNLYKHLSPRCLPAVAQGTYQLLSSNNPYDQQSALFVLDRWLASDDRATRTVASHMLRTWLDGGGTDSSAANQLHAITNLVASGYAPVAFGRWAHAVDALVRAHPSETEVRAVLDRLGAMMILPSTHPDDRGAWVTTLWTLGADSTISEPRRQMIATALHQMMQDPMVVSVVRTLLRTDLSAQRIMSEPVWDPLLATLIRTVCVDEVLRMIAEALATVRTTMGTDRDPIVRRFDRILAAGWGNGQDHRILQIIASHPGPHWETVLTEGITTSVGAEVCARIRSWFPRDQAIALIVNHIHTREDRGDWPLAPLPAHLIPWVGEAAHTCPYDLHPTTIRRLWLADPVYAWNVTQTMLSPSFPSAWHIAFAAMDAGWGTGMDDTIAAALRLIIPYYHRDEMAVRNGIQTVAAGIGRAAPAIIAALLTELAMQGNEIVQRQLVHALHRGWGHGQDDLVMHVLKTIVNRGASELVWDAASHTLAQAWDYRPPQEVLQLGERLLMNQIRRLVNHEDIWIATEGIRPATTMLAYGWNYVPTPQFTRCITQYHTHLLSCVRTLRVELQYDVVSDWVSVIAAGAQRLSASDIHALLEPLWTLSPHGCLNGIERWVCR